MLFPTPSPLVGNQVGPSSHLVTKAQPRRQAVAWKESCGERGVDRRSVLLHRGAARRSALLGGGDGHRTPGCRWVCAEGLHHTERVRHTGPPAILPHVRFSPETFVNKPVLTGNFC